LDVEAMKQFAAALSLRAEIAIVLACAFGLPLAYTMMLALGAVEREFVTDALLLRVVAFEVAMLGALGALLWSRDWTFERLGIATPSFQDVLDAVGLLVVAYLIPAGILALLPPDMKQAATNALSFTPLSLPVVVAASLVSPLFEEVFVVGYVFAVLGPANKTMAINISVALRLAYHLSQGAAAVIFILPMAVVFAWWYSTRPSLWPLLMAHIALEFLGLAPHTT
jgi:membrane protease YdiL (CAAX protease family)